MLMKLRKRKKDWDRHEDKLGQGPHKSRYTCQCPAGLRRVQVVNIDQLIAC